MKATCCTLVLLALLARQVRSAQEAPVNEPNEPEDYIGTGNRLPTRVILDHDAGIDDFITLMLLLSQPERVQLLVGVSAGVLLLCMQAHYITSLLPWVPMSLLVTPFL